MDQNTQKKLFDALRAVDTPTICNALEEARGFRTASGFTTQHMHPTEPDAPPMVGFARTGIIRAAQPAVGSAAEKKARRVGWYEYVASGEGPTVAVIQDLRFQSRHRRDVGRGQQHGSSRTGRAGLRHQRLGARPHRARQGLPHPRRQGRAQPRPRPCRGLGHAGRHLRHDRGARRPDPRRPSWRRGDPARTRGQAAGGDRSSGAQGEGDPRRRQEEGLRDRRAA